jgi:putative sterol carrier protein
MSKTTSFFTDYLPQKLSAHPDLAGKVDQIFQFDIDGLGSWHVDLTVGEGSVSTGPHDNPDCTITCSEAAFEQILDKPGSAMVLMTQGKLTVSNLAAALSLQKIF